MEYRPLARRAVFVLAALALAASSIFLLTAAGAGAVSPTAPPQATADASPDASPQATPGSPAGSSVTITAEPMLGGSFRPGTWAAVRVRLENDGPAVTGELRISIAAQGSSTYGVPVELASGARQEHVLYGQIGALTSRFVVTLMSGGAAIASITSPIDRSDAQALGVYVVADRPEALVTSIRGAVTTANRMPPKVVPIAPADLPIRIEAWASIDRLIWQDINFSGLAAEQLEALRTWVSSGGQLVILGGTTGTTSMGGFPTDLLPYQPTHVIDVPPADLQGLVGTLPAEATPLPALAGSLERGSLLAGSGNDAIAARAPYGRGSVALIGVDPSASWLAGSSAADVFWERALPPGGVRADPTQDQGDDFIVSALGNLPSVQLPRLDQLFLLIVAYIVAIGPLNYFVLRRRDRREWAWLTMPAVILLFAVAAYGFGVLIKGTDVIVNELAIVHGSTGTDRGVAEVYVGVYSPTRASFDVKVGGGALLSAPAREAFRGGEERPLDVLFGDPATLRGYSVGFGVLRGFRAEVAASTPRLEADLRLVGGVLEGSVTNASAETLAHVSLVYGNGVEIFGALAPGESRSVAIEALGSGFPGRLSDRLFGARPDANDPEAARTLIARRAIIQHLSGGWNEFDGGRGGQGGQGGGQALANGPVILAFRSGGTLDIDIGTTAQRVGETLFMLPARATVTGPVVFAGGLIGHTVVEVDAVDAFDDGDAFTMGRGTTTVDYWPFGIEGAFDVTALSIRLDQGGAASPTAGGVSLLPLPQDEQPDPDAPLASDPHPALGSPDLPEIQLFDRVTGTWIEFESPEVGRSYRIEEPARFVDSSGSLRVRFVARDSDSYLYFDLTARLEGNVR